MKNWKHGLWVGLAVHALGCGGAADEGDGEMVKGRAAFMQAAGQALTGAPQGSDDGGNGAPVPCSLVLYEPYRARVMSSYKVQGFAYVSCPTWVSEIHLAVGVEDGDELVHLRRITCRNNAMCMLGANTPYASGSWQTLAAASARGWGDSRKSGWVNLPP